MADQLSLFADVDPASPPDSRVPSVPIPEPLGEELAQLFIRVLALLLASPAEPPR